MVSRDKRSLCRRGLGSRLGEIGTLQILLYLANEVINVGDPLAILSSEDKELRMRLRRQIRGSGYHTRTRLRGW